MHLELFLFPFYIYIIFFSLLFSFSRRLFAFVFAYTRLIQRLYSVKNAGDDFFFHCDDDSENSKFSALIRLSFSSFSFQCSVLYFRSFGVGFNIDFSVYHCMKTNQEKNKGKKILCSSYSCISFVFEQKNHKYFSEAKYSGWMAVVRAMCISISLGLSMRKFLILFLLGACVCFPLRTSILSSFSICSFFELTA